MISKTWSRKSIATAVAVAVLSVYSMVVLAAPGAKASGELSVSGQVTVNGQKMVSGGTVFSDSTISTAAQSSASVSISKVGRVELSPNSNLRLSFAENSITAMLETGSAQVSTLAGTTVKLDYQRRHGCCRWQPGNHLHCQRFPWPHFSCDPFGNCAIQSRWRDQASCRWRECNRWSPDSADR